MEWYIYIYCFNLSILLALANHPSSTTTTRTTTRRKKKKKGDYNTARLLHHTTIITGFRPWIVQYL